MKRIVEFFVNLFFSDFESELLIIEGVEYLPMSEFVDFVFTSILFASFSIALGAFLGAWFHSFLSKLSGIIRDWRSSRG